MLRHLPIKYSGIILFCCCMALAAKAQDSTAVDSVLTLENVIVQAFGTNTRLLNTATAVSRIGPKELNRYDNTTILQALNTRPGVRMEERSPGSYRLNIRGSSLRSPFGVSNVKVYYDGIPFSGPGGSTDLNMLGFYNIASAEILRGPAGSMYGAGTGGALLLSSATGVFRPGFSAGYSIGSYNQHNMHASIRLGKQDAHNTISYQHTNSDGYRDHSRMRRDVVSWNALLKSSANTQLQSHFLYSDLYYQTPGALTKAEYQENPKAARPPAGIFPGADQANAAIYDQAFLAGFSLQQDISPAWQNNTTVYGYYFRHNNPTFRNYTRRVEPNFGARTNFRYEKKLGGTQLTANLGAEFQKSFITSRLYDNVDGNPGAPQTDDEIGYTTGFVFGQVKAEIPAGWIFIAGASVNKSSVRFKRFNVFPAGYAHRAFKNELAPRLALLKKLNPGLSVYASVSGGFSPPASSELLSTAGNFNRTLQAERGTNYELGAKGSLAQNRLFFEVTTFHYRLTNAIVQRQDATGGIFYNNAGATRQRGLEAYLSYIFLNKPYQFVNYAMAFASFTGNHFRYEEYKQLNTDFSGNQIAGVAPQTISAGLDMTTRSGCFAHLTYFYSGRIPLNAANTAFAEDYHIVGLKAGWKRSVFSGLQLNFFAGVQNLFNERYSLGNDINAAAGRYYNAAMGRNYYAGIGIDFDNRRSKTIK